MNKSQEILGQFKITEMSTLGKQWTGIDKIMVHAWSGKGEPHGPRVKVSNIYNRFSKRNNFSIKLSDYSTLGTVKIKSKELKDVITWIKKNKKAIKFYWNHGTDYDISNFLNKLVKV